MLSRLTFQNAFSNRINVDIPVKMIAIKTVHVKSIIANPHDNYFDSIKIALICFYCFSLLNIIFPVLALFGIGKIIKTFNLSFTLCTL